MAFIHWDPTGIIFDLGFYSLRWYSLLFALGFILSYILLKKEFKKDNLSEKYLEQLTIYIVTATIAGARLGHCLFYDFEYYSQNIAEIFLPVQFSPEFQFIGFQGLASHGAAAGILVAILLYCSKTKINLYWVIDKLALVMPLAFFCIRLGNFMNSEIIGKPTNSDWGVVFAQVDNIPRHPGQLYEAIAYLAIFGILNFNYPKFRKKPGITFGLLLILAPIARFILEFFKEDQSAFEAGMFLNMGQLLSIPFIILGILLLVRKQATGSAGATAVNGGQLTANS